VDVCIGGWNVYGESAGSRYVYNDTGDQLIMGQQAGTCARRARCMPAAVVVGQRVSEPVGESGGGGLGRSLARGYWCCD